MAKRGRAKKSRLLDEAPFAYCTYKAYEIWSDREWRISKAISDNPTGEDVGNALAYFRASRSFAGIRKVGSKEFSPMVEDIRTKLSAVCDLQLTAVAAVEKLAHDLRDIDVSAEDQEGSEGKKKVSAASKLLWLGDKDTYIINDSRARRALRVRLGHGSGVDDTYRGYFTAWETEFENFSGDLVKGVSTFKNNSHRYPKIYEPNSDISALANQNWFKKRVFDIFLFEIGGNKHSLE